VRLDSRSTIPGSGLPDQVSKSIIDNVTSAMIPARPALARDKVSNICMSHYYEIIVYEITLSFISGEIVAWILCI
jgi:hypothetical protein